MFKKELKLDFIKDNKTFIDRNPIACCSMLLFNKSLALYGKEIRDKYGETIYRFSGNGLKVTGIRNYSSFRWEYASNLIVHTRYDDEWRLEHPYLFHIKEIVFNFEEDRIDVRIDNDIYMIDKENWDLYRKLEYNEMEWIELEDFIFNIPVSFFVRTPKDEDSKMKFNLVKAIPNVISNVLNEKDFPIFKSRRFRFQFPFEIDIFNYFIENRKIHLFDIGKERKLLIANLYDHRNSYLDSPKDCIKIYEMDNRFEEIMEVAAYDSDGINWFDIRDIISSNWANNICKKFKIIKLLNKVNYV